MLSRERLTFDDEGKIKNLLTQKIIGGESDAIPQYRPLLKDSEIGEK